MAGIRLSYIGGGSTRAPGTLSAIVDRAERFSGSELVLMDLDLDHLSVVQRLAQAMARARGADLTIRVTTDRREALRDADIVLTSFRPGGFEARELDETIPLRHGVIGQETQGPGGFFMALRTIHVMKDIVSEMASLCPGAVLINYTNPVNIVSEAITHHSDIQTISLCEGPLTFPGHIAEEAGLDPNRLDTEYVGLNHTGWTVRHRYDGGDVMPLIEKAAEGSAPAPSDFSEEARSARMLQLAATMGALPGAYLYYYYYHEIALAEMRAKSTTRARDILQEVDQYWAHYREQAESAAPAIDPDRSRRAVLELELAVDVIDAIVNNTGDVWPVNVPNRRSVLAGFPSDLVVEVPAVVDRWGAHPIAVEPLPVHLLGLIQALGAYQAATAEAAWHGSRRDAVRALAAHPLVLSLDLAEALYGEMSAAHRGHLPDRLLA